MTDMSDEQTEVEEIIRRFAHDVRTPMTTVRGFADLLIEDESISAESREHAAIVLSEADNMARILNEMLAKLGIEKHDQD